MTPEIDAWVEQHKDDEHDAFDMLTPEPGRDVLRCRACNATSDGTYLYDIPAPIGAVGLDQPIPHHQAGCSRCGAIRNLTDLEIHDRDHQLPRFRCLDRGACEQRKADAAPSVALSILLEE